MIDTLPRLLLRLSEAGDPAILWGRQAAPHRGPDFERLLDRGILVEQAPATEWDVCTTCQCGAGHRPIQWIDDRPVAVCPLDRANDAALTGQDLRSFRIDQPALVGAIAQASGLAQSPSAVMPGVWHLGRRADRRVVFLVPSRAAAGSAGLMATLRLDTASSATIVIAPAMPAAEQVRFEAAGIATVTIEDCIGNAGNELGIDWTRLVRPQPGTPRLVIFRLSQRVILDGIEMHIPQQPFKLLVMLAEAVGGRSGYLTPHQIEAENSGRGAADLVRELRRFLSEGERGRGADLIKTRRSPTGYFLALAPGEFDLRP